MRLKQIGDECNKKDDDEKKHKENIAKLLEKGVCKILMARKGKGDRRSKRQQSCTSRSSNYLRDIMSPLAPVMDHPLLALANSILLYLILTLRV